MRFLSGAVASVDTEVVVQASTTFEGSELLRLLRTNEMGVTLTSTESSDVSVVASVGLVRLLVSRRASRSRSSPPSELPEQKPASRSLEFGEPDGREREEI